MFDPSAIHEENEEEEDDKPKSFEDMFKLFVKLKEPKSDGTLMCLTASNRWMKHAKILDGRKVTETDTGVAFYKFKRRAIPMENYLLFLQDLCDTKGLDFEQIKKKMAECGDPRKEKGMPKQKRNEFKPKRSTDVEDNNENTRRANKSTMASSAMASSVMASSASGGSATGGSATGGSAT